MPKNVRNDFLLFLFNFFRSFLSIRCSEHVLIHLPISFEVYFRNCRNSKCVCVWIETTSTFNWWCASARAIKYTWTNVGYVGIFVFYVFFSGGTAVNSVPCSNRSSCNGRHRRCCVPYNGHRFVCCGMPPFIGILTRCRRYIRRAFMVTACSTHIFTSHISVTK